MTPRPKARQWLTWTAITGLLLMFAVAITCAPWNNTPRARRHLRSMVGMEVLAEAMTKARVSSRVFAEIGNSLRTADEWRDSIDPNAANPSTLFLPRNQVYGRVVAAPHLPENKRTPLLWESEQRRWARVAVLYSSAEVESVLNWRLQRELERLRATEGFRMWIPAPVPADPGEAVVVTEDRPAGRPGPDGAAPRGRP